VALLGAGALSAAALVDPTDGLLGSINPVAQG
jgi:hypothetical protein